MIQKLPKFKYSCSRLQNISVKLLPSVTGNFSLFKSSEGYWKSVSDSVNLRSVAINLEVLNLDLKIRKGSENGRKL